MKKKCNKGELLNDYTPFSAKSDKTVAGRARRLTYPPESRQNPIEQGSAFRGCAIATTHSTASPTLVPAAHGLLPNQSNAMASRILHLKLFVDSFNFFHAKVLIFKNLYYICHWM
ncbi:hypothetical protein [Sodaliphilus pleomorphus]|uniref:Uncharacterized protein n=1 Tax=Sodaliphilus pleomorphus TaxID=2606626 RepID=A0A6L5X9Q7_9BACT|nr:hypothetical protein [Sodaliphilus pleomorphus]MSS16357.1 hypothetical protein [Sodaliphilus pleomorphus]